MSWLELLVLPALVLCSAFSGFALHKVLTLPSNAGMKRNFADLVDHVDSMATKLNGVTRAQQALDTDVEAQLDQITGRLQKVKQRETNEKRRNGGVDPQTELTAEEQFAALEADLWPK